MAEIAQSTRACKCCATAKARCSFTAPDSSQNSSKCERCTRLNKDCVRPEVARKRRLPKITRTAQLEQKLDGIVSLLNAAQQVNPSALRDLPITSRSTQYSSSSAAQDTPAASPDSVVFSDEEISRNLDSYRSNFMKNFPAIFIGPDVTPQELQQKKPFLFRAIMSVCSYTDTELQVSRGLELRKLFAEHIVVQGQRSLDILQALLVFTAWHHYHLGVQSMLTMLLGLIESMLVDLGYNKPIPSTEQRHSLMEEMRHTHKLCARDNRPLSLEERRVIIGAFYLSSIVTCSFSKSDSLRFTPVMKECCDVISQAAEYETDELLVYMVKIQYIVERVRQCGFWDCSSDPSTPKAPGGLYIRTFEKELRDLAAASSERVQTDKLMKVHYHAAEINVYEACFHLPSSALVDPLSGMQRLDMLYGCYNACKVMLEVFWSIPAMDSYFFTLATYGQLGGTFQALARLSFFDGEGWDPVQVRESMSFINLLDTTTARLNQLVDTTDPAYEKSAWYKTMQKVKWYRQWYHSKLPPEQTSTAATSGELSGQTFLEPPTQLDFLIPDNNFWQELSGDWNIFQL